MQQEPEKTQMVNGEATQTFSASDVDVTQMAVTIKCPVCNTLNTKGETYCSECGFLLTSELEELNVSLEDEMGAYLVEPSSGRKFAIRPGKNSVGRQDSDILLSDPSISRSHGVIVEEGGSYYLEDLGSTNGTLADGNLVKQGERVELITGAQIKFGSVSMEFHLPDVPEPPLVEPSMETEIGTDHPEEIQAQEEEAITAPTPSSPEVEEDTEEIFFTDIGEEFAVESKVEPETVEPQTIEPAALGQLTASDGTIYNIHDGITTIGRSGDNDIVIADPFVSGHHAQFNATAEQIYVTDIGSTNGTMVDGNLLEKDVPMNLQDRATVQFGKLQFMWERFE